MKLTYHVNRGVAVKVILSDKLKKSIGEDYRHLNKKAGQYSRVFKRRINEIKSMANCGDYLRYGLGNPHLLDGDFEGHLGVNISSNYRLIVRLCTSDYSPESLAACDKVIIEGVVDYHGKRSWIIP